MEYKKPSLLIVDDEPNIHLALKLILEPDGYNIDSAYDGEEALDRLSTEYDLVITDKNMPNMGGLELFDELKKRHFKTKVILLSGNLTPGEKNHLIDKGVDMVFDKPIYDIKAFLNNIEQLIEIKAVH